MAVARVDKNTDHWLFTSQDSDKVRDIEADSRVEVHDQEIVALAQKVAASPTAPPDRASIASKDFQP